LFYATKTDAPSLLPANWWHLPLASLAALAPVEPLHWDLAQRHNCRIWVKREDRLHPQLGGNKLYKLYFWLQQALALGVERLVSFGGAYSNHLYALAAAAQALQLKSLGFLRGELQPNPLQQDLLAMGMALESLSRQDYALQNEPSRLAQWLASYPSSLVIPEGGGGEAGLRGFKAYGEALTQMQAGGAVPDCDWVLMPSGTGTSISGLAAGVAFAPVAGVSALRLGERFAAHQSELQAQAASLHDAQALGAAKLCLWPTEGTGRFGQLPGPVQQFYEDFYQQTGLPLDPVYGVKLFYTLAQRLQAGLCDHQTLLVIHTGGLQGWRGFHGACSGHKVYQQQLAGI
jgi:1-aminocyclopropane-1-carboxylate deaminase